MNTYLVNLFLLNNVVVGAVPVSEGGIAGADILIGMGIITMSDFAITNCDGLLYGGVRSRAGGCIVPGPILGSLRAF